jgi:hypothetical protein
MPRKFAQTTADPMLPRTPIEIDGKTYNMCFDFGAILEAESAYAREGHQANLLVNFRNFSFYGVRMVFPCAVRTFHPELTWDQARALVNMGNVFDIGNAIFEAWNAAQVKKEPAKEETEEESPAPNPPDA